jgi:hypothetical protein
VKGDKYRVDLPGDPFDRKVGRDVGEIPMKRIYLWFDDPRGFRSYVKKDVALWVGPAQGRLGE